MFNSRFPFYHQLEMVDCGPSCLRMIAKYYGRRYSLEYLREVCHISRSGVSLLGIKKGAEKIGLTTAAVKTTYEQLVANAPLPCILHWRQEHFVVLVKVERKKNGEDRLLIADPGFGMIYLNKEKFLESWTNTEEGIALLIDTTDEFAKIPPPPKQHGAKKGFNHLISYLRPHRKVVGQLLLGMLIGAFVNLSFPILTQKLVDNGVVGQNYSFIVLVLLAQLFLFFGGLVVELIRDWLLLHVNTKINLKLISDFLVKLMNLPIGFFDERIMGDLTQRIDDHERIEDFLTSHSLTIIFSMVNFLVFSAILFYYSSFIFLVFFIGSFFSVFWILLFLRKRKHIDYHRFELMARNRNRIYEIIMGMQEIKLNSCEDEKRWEWENIQADLFDLNQRNLRLEQLQETGVSFFNQLKNILIIFITAKFVLDGSLTLGVLLSISYIVGQLNGPIVQLISFFHAAQDAKISFDRLGQIHNLDEEEQPDYLEQPELGGVISHDEEVQSEEAMPRPAKLSAVQGITLQNVSFRYDELSPKKILKDIDLFIPEGKITAIVGTSGSGKTTLMKLLLRFYDPESGHIQVNDKALHGFIPKLWRKRCGAVMQEGYLFADTIANNISLARENTDQERLLHAATVANIHEYILGLPMKFNTKIGSAGQGLSVGQKQRMLIARAVYKNPDYLFFDEATSALDANNEKVIMENLNQFFQGKTVVVIAHRLSTVKNADQIIVLENGEIVEKGNHEQLSKEKGHYYNLVKNQLELGG